MSRLVDDVRDKSLWKECRRRPLDFEVSYWDSGAEYVDTRDMKRTRATITTPILVNDHGHYWTETVQGLQRKYLQPDGAPIDSEVIGDLINGETVRVIANVGTPMAAFKVYTDKYGFDCLYGANRSNIYRGDGDYLVCDCDKGYLDLTTVEVVHESTFERQFKKKEAELMFEVKDNIWYCNGHTYEDVGKALVALADNIMWGSGNKEPIFGDLGLFIPTRLALIYAIYKMDVPAVFSSRRANDYTQETGKDAEIMKCSDINPLFAKMMTIPTTYRTPNKGLHQTLFPKTKEIYGSCKQMIATSKGSYPFDLVFSYACDKILFSGELSPFKSGLDVFEELDKHKPTQGIDMYCTHEDLPRLKILAAQLRAGDVKDIELITIGDVRKCRYPSYTKDKVGAGVDYVQQLLYSPPSLYCEDYNEWSAKVLNIEQEVRKVVDMQELPPLDETSVPEEFLQEESLPEFEVEDIFADAMNLPEEPDDLDNQNMHNVAYVYCSISGVDFDITRDTLRNFGVEKWEDFYRALPVYLRRTGKGVHESVLLQYCNLLEANYGSCRLAFDPK